MGAGAATLKGLTVASPVECSAVATSARRTAEDKGCECRTDFGALDESIGSKRQSPAATLLCLWLDSLPAKAWHAAPTNRPR